MILENVEFFVESEVPTRSVYTKYTSLKKLPLSWTISLKAVPFGMYFMKQLTIFSFWW
jgi:hypothetical protein